MNSINGVVTHNLPTQEFYICDKSPMAYNHRGLGSLPYVL